MTEEGCSIISRMNAVSFWKWKKNKCYFLEMDNYMINHIDHPVLTTIYSHFKIFVAKFCFFMARNIDDVLFTWTFFSPLNSFLLFFKKFKTQRINFVLNFKISSCKSVEFQCFDLEGIHNQIGVTKIWNPRCNLWLAIVKRVFLFPQIFVEPNILLYAICFNFDKLL